MDSVYRIESFKSASLNNLESLKDETMPEPQTTLLTVQETSPSLLKVLCTLTSTDNRAGFIMLYTLFGNLS